MNRQIKFRGYVKDISEFGDDVVPHKGHFVFGNLIHVKAFSYIVGEMVEANDEYATLEYWKPVDNENIDEFTGLKDRNGKEIYEGDILAWHSNIYRKQDWVGLVTYRGAGFAVQESGKARSTSGWLECASREGSNIVEIIGNVHENPELLE
ncbi:YopX family protein, partial [Lentilactobacillus farraginis]